MKTLANPFDAPIYQFESCTSTNDLALDLAKNDAPHGTIVTSNNQTHGKGRNNRTWLTAHESLMFSLIIRPYISTFLAPRLTLITAISLLETLKKFNVNALVKWPNDIIILSKDQRKLPHWGLFRKLAGILVEISSLDNQIEAAIIGIGLNLKNAKDDTQFSHVPHATFLNEHGFKIQKNILFQTLLESLYLNLNQVHSEQHWPLCLKILRKHSAILNQNIILFESNHEIHAKAINLNLDGSLKVQKPDGTMKNIYAGDIWLSDID